jgi:hypothetical protein
MIKNKTKKVIFHKSIELHGFIRIIVLDNSITSLYKYILYKYTYNIIYNQIKSCTHKFICKYNTTFEFDPFNS